MDDAKADPLTYVEFNGMLSGEANAFSYSQGNKHELLVDRCLKLIDDAWIAFKRKGSLSRYEVHHDATVNIFIVLKHE